MADQHLSLRIEGLVQGVGMRPHVLRLALAEGLRGTVANDSQGVVIELEGPRDRLDAFVNALEANPPARGRIDRRWLEWSDALSLGVGFRILSPDAEGQATALVSPDLALCSACARELEDPQSRRFAYPFISCTDCGPRYTLLERLPFERQHTPLRAFPLCRACQREYADPGDRRFHAQTISCPICGPRLLWNGSEKPYDLALDAAASLLQGGGILALQAMGGFQLLVDPTREASVQRLRQGKARPEKPLALLATEPWVQKHCELDGQEQVLWRSAIAPILLLRRRCRVMDAVCPAVAFASPWLGVMRPSSGLQHLLLARTRGALVATSANRSGEPIAADAQMDGDRLVQLADGVLSCGLPIVNRIDDSVMRWAADGPLLLRLGRGLAPMALPAASPDPGAELAGALALGAQSKAGFALRLPHHRLLSPDLGELSGVASIAHWQQTCLQWQQRHQLSPRWIGCDRHPGYIATRVAWEKARAGGLLVQSVQHHEAHLLAVIAEHALGDDAYGDETVGVAWDGAGLGDDGNLWGGEGLAITPHGTRRLAHLRPFPLPGGACALREPRRATLGLLLAAFGGDWRSRIQGTAPQRWLETFGTDDLMLLERSVKRGFNAPRTTSIGRLFDAVAALLGGPQRCSYEAQAALWLEGLALSAHQHWDCSSAHRWGAPQLDLPLLGSEAAEPWLWCWVPLLEQLLQAGGAGLDPAALALAFHQALADAIAAFAYRASAETLLLAGGCFQNALLLELSVAALQTQGCRALWSQQLPCNDAALPIGQLLAVERSA